MRSLGVAAALSVAVNLVAGWWFAERMARAHVYEVPAVGPAAPPPPPAPEPAPIVVTLLPDDAAPARGASAAVPARRGAVPRGEAHIVTSTATTEAPPVEVAPVAPAAPPAPHRSALSMRAPERANPFDKMSDAAFDKLFEPPPPPPNIPGLRATREIEAIQQRLHDPHYMATASGDAIAGDRWAIVALREQRDAEELKGHKDGTYTANHTTYDAVVARDGTVKLRDKPNVKIKSPFEIEFDVNDALMRSHGMDPYAHEKLAFLDRTREQRAEIGKWNEKELLSHSAAIMRDNLARAWARSRTLAARKQAMFDLWDECEERGDGDRVDAAADAREQVVKYIRFHLAGADAYTAAELAQLNATRRSTAAFAPYE